MRVPGSKLRDPDFIVIPMFAAALVAIVSLVTGGSETFLYVTAQQDPLTHIGPCTSKTIEAPCVTFDNVFVAASNGDDVTLQYVGGSQQVHVKRVAWAQPSEFPKKDDVIVECYQGDMVALKNRTTGAVMKLENFPEPPLRLWVPEMIVGGVCLLVWIGLFFYRRYLFSKLVVHLPA